MILNLNLQTTKNGHDRLLCQGTFIASLGRCGMASWNLRYKIVFRGWISLSLPISHQDGSLQ